MDSNMRQITLLMLVLLALVSFFTTSCASDVFPKAKNVSWTSVNFKSMLTWSPKPTNYSYTVEFSELSQDRERTPHCIRTMDTECDLTAVLKNLKAYYSADVLSEPMRGVSSDLVEFPHVSSGKFSPYHDTDIGRPEFRVEVSSDKRMTKLHVTDVPTALFDDQKKRLNIRDVFGDDLQYRVTYRKAKSTGKKETFSKKSIIEMADLDRGVSYCFNVQAYLPSRPANKQLGELSRVHCSREENTSIFEEYSSGVITGVVFILLAIIVIVLVIVMCLRRRRKEERKGKEKDELAMNGV